MKIYLFIPFIILVAFTTLNLYAQKNDIIITEGTAQIEFPTHKSRVQVEKEAEELAKINALEKAFGRVVFQGNSTYISNINSGTETETKSVFNMLGNTYVKGEVLEIIDVKFKEIPGYKTIDGKKTKIKDLECKIKLKARELAEPKIDFEVEPLSYTDKRFKTTSFKNNDTLYLYFKSPVSGYLSVFLVDNKYSSRLLPYTNENQGGIPVKADKEYIFFAPDTINNYYYVLYTETMQDLSRMFIIFSKNPINKPFLKKNINPEILSEFEKEQGYFTPDGLESVKFQKWLQKNRYARKDIQVKIIDITITK